MSSSTQLPELTPSQLNYAETSQWKEILRQELADLRCAAPGIIQSWDPGKQVASVQVALREIVRTPSGPDNTAIAVIYNVPICLPRAGGFSLLLPIAAGNECLLIFADMCIDLWWARGGVQNQFERRRHDLSDCFFIPGPWSQPKVVSNYPTDSAQLRSDDGTVTVEVAEAGITLTGPKVTINSSGDVDISASGQVKISSAGNNSEIDGTEFMTHLHTGVTSGGSNTGPVV